MDKLAELRRKLGVLTDDLEPLAHDAKAYAAKEAEIEALEAEIRNIEKARKRSASLAREVVPPGSNTVIDNVTGEEVRNASLSTLTRELGSHIRREGRGAEFGDALSIARRGIGFSVDKTKHFSSFGEQLQAIAQHYYSKGTQTDSRLVYTKDMITRAPTGAGEVDPTSGGFLVQVDFATSIFMLSHSMGELLKRVNKIPISANSNGLKIPGVDETSRANGSRWGGVVTNWAAEGIPGTESRPTFNLIEFDLKKLISKMTTTEELLQDAAALQSVAAQAFSEEITFTTELAIFQGTGSGQPLGILKSPAAVQVAKQSGQASATIVKENIDNMWMRRMPQSRDNLVWLITQDAEPQLNQMVQVVGTGGIPAYLLPGGLSASPFATLYGRPVITTEYNPAVGSPGDIMLVDLGFYTLIDKGGVQMATSMHVAFDTDEMRFRITYRVDGRPMRTTPLTPFNGGATKSPFVSLAQR